MERCLRLHRFDDSIKTPLNEQLDGLSDLITNLSYGFAAFYQLWVKLFVFLQFLPWISWLLLIPTALFFWLVIKKFEYWSKTACIATIVAFFASLIGGVLWLHNLVMPGQECHTFSLTHWKP